VLQPCQNGVYKKSLPLCGQVPRLVAKIERLPDDARPDPWGGPRAVSYRIPVSRRTGRRPTDWRFGRHLPPGLRNRSVPVPRDAERIVGGV